MRKKGVLIICILVLGLHQGSVGARMSDKTLGELQDQAEKEGWKFTLGRNAATERPAQALCGALPPDPNDPELKRRSEELAERQPPVRLDSLPNRWDWREHNAVPPIRDQEGCGSCWAHAAVGVVESAILIASSGSLSPSDIDLSEQWLIDCATDDDPGSCSEGWVTVALDKMKWWADEGYGKDYDGAVLERDCTYTGTEEMCGSSAYSHPFGIEDWHLTSTSLEDLKQAIYEHGPITARVSVYESFQAYMGGIYDRNEGAPVGEHYVILVGWDDTDGPGVFILRNSWGTTWGEAGYMRIDYSIFGAIRGGDTCYVEYQWDKDAFAAHWALDEGSGNIAHDSTGDKHGNVHGATWTSGEIAGALEFDGTDDYVSLPDTVIMRDEYAKTVSAWIRVDTWKVCAKVFRWRDERNTITMALHPSEGKIAAGTITKTDGVTGTCTVGPVCSTGEWHHICCTYDGVTTCIYADGWKKEVTEDDASAWDTTDAGAFVGKGSSTFPQQYFDGRIDDVRLYTYALSIGEIWDLAFYDMSKSFTIRNDSGVPVARFDDAGNLFLVGSLFEPESGPGKELVGHWKFDEVSGDTAYDSVGDNDGTLHNMESGDRVPGRVGGALQFDGVDEYVSLFSPVIALTGTTTTIMAWIRADITPEKYRHIVAQLYYDDEQKIFYGYDLLLYGNRPRLYLGSSGVAANTVIDEGDWYHLAGTYDGNYLRIYVNGALTGYTFTCQTGYDTDAYIGWAGYTSPISAEDYFAGAIDDVRIYNYAMTELEIREVIPPAVARFSMENSLAERVAWFDESGNLFLKGTAHIQQNPLNPAVESDDFIIKNNNGDVVAYISDSGHLYLKGSLYEYEE